MAIPRQPGDALLVKWRLAAHRTLDERHARRVGGKPRSPVDPNDADSLRALRTETTCETRDELGSDRDPRRMRVCRRLNRFDRPAYWSMSTSSPSEVC